MGTGPADVIKVVAGSFLFDIRTDQPGDSAFDFLTQLPSGQQLPCIEYVIAANCGPTRLFEVPVTPADEATAVAGYPPTKIRKAVGISGDLLYRGTTPEIYRTSFFWFYLALESQTDFKGLFLKGPERF